MKRWIITLSFIMIFLSFINSTAFASGNIISVSMNGSNVKVKEVPILMNGQAFKADVPSFIYVDRTLVPIRFVAESLGAKVDWEQNTKTATVTHSNKVIKLTIDSPNVSINNDKKTLDKNSIPKLVTFNGNDARTMVPVRFVSEVLGYEVGWDENNQTPYINSSDDNEVIDLDPEIKPNPIEPQEPVEPKEPVDSPKPNENTISIKGVDITKGSTSNQKVSITGDGKIEYDTLFLPDSNKLIIDIKNSRLNTKNTGDAPGDISVNDINFNRVQYSQYSTNPYTTRVVVTMYDKHNYEILPSNDGKTITLHFVNEIKGISMDRVDGKDALVINGAVPKYNIMKLKNPERIVVDLMDATLGGTSYANYDYNFEFISGIRTSQFQDDSNYSNSDRIVRVVIDVKDGIVDPNIKIETEGDRLIIYPEKDIWKNISYMPQGKDKLLVINNLERTRYEVDYNSTTNTMEITIPSESVDLNEGFATVKDGLVDEIEVTKYKEDTKVILRFKAGLEYTVLSGRKDSNIQISLRREPGTINTNKTIVIDAGHGGTAPGAISVNGTKEKDINLQVSLKLESILRSLGYNVVMTRSGDQTLGLYERSDLANNLNADIFVSIHSNSHTNRDIAGLQVLYCPLYDSNKKSQDQYPLAKSIMDAVLASTGAADKGIIPRKDLVVVRETKMPAVLVEVGFLSNAAEEKLITNDSYQNKIVEGIVTGIQNYFEMY